MNKIKIVVDLLRPNLTDYYIQPVTWFLKAYHQNFSKSKNDYSWSLPYVIIEPHDITQIFNELAKEILSQQVAIVGFSHYVWTPYMLEMAKNLKSMFPGLIIVFGGPELDAHKNVNFFKTHDYIDWVVYGDGEHAFGNLLDYLAGYPVSLFNVVSCDGTVYPHQVFSSKEALKKSPYLENKIEIVEVLGRIKNKLSAIPTSNKNLIMIWETTKGCPYGCSFCDWNSGLHNKVRIWGRDELVPNWQKELDFFTENKIYTIYWTNPNVGLSAQDSDIVDYLCELRKTNPNSPSIINLQLAKLNKEKSYALLDKLLESGVSTGFKFDLQDLDPEVLNNVDRPDVPWVDHKLMIQALVDKHSFTQNSRANRFNFIWGLPGQTLDHLKNNMFEAGAMGFLANHYPFLILPNAPAADVEYQDKFKIVVKNILIPYYYHTTPFSANTVVSTMSLTEKDWFIGIIIYSIYAYFYEEEFDVLGKEAILWKNYSKIQNIIDASYKYFVKTSTIMISTSIVPVPLYQYLERNKELYYRTLFS